MPPSPIAPSDLSVSTTASVDWLKQQLQQVVNPNWVIVIGSGLSVAEGISGMGGLARHLIDRMPMRLPSGRLSEWEPVAAHLAGGKTLEEALQLTPQQEEVEMALIAETASLIRQDESVVLREIVHGDRVLRLTHLLRRFPRGSEPITVITPNYDRLVEFAAEDADLGVDTMFVGNVLGRYDKKAATISFIQELRQSGKRLRPVLAPRIRLHKPHGSLDWCLRGDRPARVSPEFVDIPLIITPGLNKYRHGYSVPFDHHRERANADIDAAAGFLVVGYGFNDDHLETHLSPAIRAGRPTIIVTHTLSPTARQLSESCSNVLALEHGTGKHGEGTVICHGGARQFLPDMKLWDLGEMMREVFGD